jgi:c-di-GMP-binding flagellar brake protein YcgR
MKYETDGRDKRGSRRAFFTLDEDTFARISVPWENDKAFPVKLLSISCGGIGVVAIRCKIPELHVGDRLTLTDIKTPPQGTIDRAEVSVKYIADDNLGFRLSMGCEFLDITPPESQKITNFVRNRFIRMGFDA